MPDYKELYLKLFRASNQAIELLIAVQRECEEWYCSAEDTELEVLDFTKKDHSETETQAPGAGRGLEISANMGI